MAIHINGVLVAGSNISVPYTINDDEVNATNMQGWDKNKVHFRVYVDPVTTEVMLLEPYIYYNNHWQQIKPHGDTNFQLTEVPNA